MTPQELKSILQSKENKMAKKAIEIIKAGEPITKLVELIEKGCPDTFYERNPSHPRKSYLTHKVLDACFESKLGIEETKSEVYSGVKIETAKIDHIHNSQEKEVYFKLLLNAGFTPGTNNYRGELFKHILNSCFYFSEKEENKKSAIKFANILIELKKVDINHYAINNYSWVGSMDKLQTILELGANPLYINKEGKGMIDCAINYIGCSPNSGEKEGDRAKVVKELLKLGATPNKPISQSISYTHIIEALNTYSLIAELSKFGIIDKKIIDEYSKNKIKNDNYIEAI